MSTFDLFVECAEATKEQINEALNAVYDGDGEKANQALREALARVQAMLGPLSPPECRNTSPTGDEA